MTTVKFVRPLNNYLVCPACNKIFNQPVINVKCGHTYCLSCLTTGIAADNSSTKEKTVSCPADSTECRIDELVVNRAIQGQVDDQEVYCRYGLTWSDAAKDFVPDSNGCQAIVKYGNVKQHEDLCEFALLPCPSSSSECGLHRRHSLQKHLDRCRHMPCPHRDKGCQFSGTMLGVKHHTLLCQYTGKPSDGSILVDSNRLEQLVSSHTALVTTVDKMSERIDRLEEQHVAQSGQLDNCLRLLTELRAKNEELSNEIRRVRQNEMLPTTRQRLSLHAENNALPGQLVRSSSASASSSLNLFGSAGNKTKVETWNMPFQFKCIGTWRSHKGGVWSLQSHMNLIYSCGADCCIKVWDLDDLIQGCKRSIVAHSERVHALAVGSSFLYSAGDDLAIKAWNLRDLLLHQTVEKAHDQSIAALVCTADYVFSSSYTVIKVWHSQTLALTHTIPDLYHWVRSMTLNSTKDRLYSGSHGAIDIWDVKVNRFNLLGKISHTFGSVYALAVTKQYIIAGTYNQNIHIYDVTTLQYLQQWTGHVGIINCILASPSGRFMFSSSSDSTVMIWSLEKMLPIQTLQRHSDSVNTMAISGDLLLTGSEDTEIKVFKYFHMQMGFVPVPS